MSTGSSLEVLVGLTGTKASGKDECGKRLVERHGFVMRRTSDAIRRVALEEHGWDNPTVKQMQDIGDAGRIASGGCVWIDRLIRHAEEGGEKKLIINGIRHPGEMQAILSRGFGYMLSIDAPTLRRWEWFQKRQQSGDSYIRTFEEFIAMDDRDRGVGQPYGGQQVGSCMGFIKHQIILDAEAAADGDARDRQRVFAYCNDGSLDFYHHWIDDLAPFLMAVK